MMMMMMMMPVFLHTRVSASHRLHLLLCFAALIILYSSIHFLHLDHHQSSPLARPIAIFDDQSSSDLRSHFSFVIKLLTFDRLLSLGRCLDSLVSADYTGHNVTLHVFIDHFPLSDEASSLHGKLKEDFSSSSSSNGKLKEVPPSSSSSSSMINAKLKEAHEILQYVDRFIWPHGPKQIHYRSQNVGLQGQWLEAWWPASDHEFAFVVEDDMILSPLYFKYLRRIIHTYYFDPSNYDPTIYGISLQRPRFVPGKHGNPLQVDNSTNLFLYQLVGTWGQLLFPRPWKEFRIWYDTHKSKNLKPFLEGMVTTGWYRRSKERIWTPWFIKFVQSKGYFNLYTHFINAQALSVSHRDIGVNTRKEAGPDSDLIENESSFAVKSWEMKPTKHLKRYNYCFQEVIQWRLVKNIHDMYKVVPSLHINGTIIVVNAIGYPEVVIRNWLCQFSKFSIKNYLILLENPVLEKEFMRRGHAVMHIDLAKHGFHNYDIATKRNLVIAQAITWVLQVGYNVWVTSVDTLWMTNPMPGISVSDADMLGFADRKGISTELFYTRTSKETLSVWEKLYIDGLHIPTASAGQILSKDAIIFKPLPATLTMDIFMYNTNHTDGTQSRVTLLTGIQDSDICTSLLKLLGFWMLDDELSCTGVYC